MDEIILIAGDKWGCGEWSLNTSTDNLVDNSEILHGGLGQYLGEYGYNVINLSRHFNTLNGVVKDLTLFLGANERLVSKIKHVLIFQPEWHRDFPVWHDPTIFPTRLDIYKSQAGYIDNFYINLSHLAQKYDCIFSIIGGSSDAFPACVYPNVKILVQSMTNLLVIGEEQIENPVFSLWSGYSAHLDLFKTEIKDQQLFDQFIQDFHLALKRTYLWGVNSDLFFPDGSHPNRKAHKILFEYLTPRSDFFLA